MIILPRTNTYTIDEGKYQTVLQDVFTQPNDFVRFVFRITSISHPRRTHLAGKNYSTKDGTKLAVDLDTWLGDDVDLLLQPNGGVTIEGLKSLVGREADINVILIENDEHKNEFRYIQEIRPPGTLVKRIPNLTN